MRTHLRLGEHLLSIKKLQLLLPHVFLMLEYVTIFDVKIDSPYLQQNNLWRFDFLLNTIGYIKGA